MPRTRAPAESFIDPELAEDETSEERFDRAEFARRALDLVGTQRTTVVICEGARRVRLESGRIWGRPPPESRWALLAVSPTASRRAIVMAVAELARVPKAYAFDVLLRNAPAP